MAIYVRYFELSLWRDLGLVRRTQLVEEGIPEELIEVSNSPDVSSPYDQDLNQIDSIYTCKRGGFWLAYADEQAVGYVGLQDISRYGELRRMYVMKIHRRQGIGLRLCSELMIYAKRASLKTIELWTARNGVGQMLYQSLGFRVVEFAKMGSEQADEAIHDRRDAGEIRMRLEL